MIGYPVLPLVKRLVRLIIVSEVEPGLGGWGSLGCNNAAILPRLLVLEFGGAAGTLGVLERRWKPKRPRRSVWADIAWHTERDRIAEVGAFFEILRVCDGNLCKVRVGRQVGYANGGRRGI